MPRRPNLLEISAQTIRKPGWLRVRYPTSENHEKIAKILQASGLHTVCEEAHCPNAGECWGGGTATFMLMGDKCTRACGFCMVKSGNPHRELDLFEPARVAETIAELGLSYVAITSVDRDDLPDGGASHFASTIKAIKHLDPQVIVEVLIPDFQGNLNDLKKVLDGAPEVVAHNVETTESLTSKIRDRRATYKQSLRVLKGIKDLNSQIYTKSSIMLGLGEKDEDLIKTMRDLRDVQVDILTLGQYLQPSKWHIPIYEYISPDKFNQYRVLAEEMGFLYVASGPFVRSSYRAGEFFVEALMTKKLLSMNSCKGRIQETKLTEN